MNIGLGLLLIPFIGVWGATICCSAAMFVRTALVSTGEARALAVPFGEIARSIGGIFVGILVSTLVWGVVGALDLAPVPVALVAGLAGALIYLLVLRATRVGMSSEDADAIARGLPGRLRGPTRLLLSLAAQHQMTRT